MATDRYKSAHSVRHKRGNPSDDRWTGPLAIGDWVIVEGPMGYGYGYGQIEALRPVNISLTTRTHVRTGPRVRRDEIRDVVPSRAAAQDILDRLERLRLSQPFGVFNQRHYQGRYQDLLRQT